MALPTFIGIGVPRAGTTWLHALLDSHPDVYVPSRRKELNYFDLYYGRGLTWYEKFFPSGPDAARYRAIGEITPYYFYGADCPARMARLHLGKFLLILRNPIDRAWSWYALMVRDGHFRGSFESFLTQSRWPVIQHGSYSKYLQAYLRYFHRDQFLIFIYENAITDVAATKQKLGDFLGVASGRFPPLAGTAVLNESYVPKAPRIYGLAVRAGRLLRKWDADWVVNAAKRYGVKECFGRAGRAQPMAEQTRERLRKAFEDELRILENLLEVSLDVWR